MTQTGSVLKKPILFAGVVVMLVSWFFMGIPWGVYSANFITFLGITQGCLAILVLLWLLGAEWLSSYLVPVSVITLSFAPMAILFFLGLTGGQEVLFYWSRTESHSPWFSSPVFVARNLVSMLLFYGAVIYVVSSYLKDKTKHVYPLCFLLVFFVLNQTIVSWDFGMHLYPDGHNTLFAPYYWFGGLYAGLAILMLVLLTTEKKIIKTPKWISFRKLLFSFSLIWAYLWWSQFITTWYANLPEETTPFYMRFSGEFALASGLMFLCLFVIPFATIIMDRRNKLSLKPLLILILLGNWLDRYLMVIPPVRHLNEGVAHFPQQASWLTTVGFLAGFFLLLSLCYRPLTKRFQSI